MGKLYKVVKAKHSRDLENKVNLLMQEGWEPCGNVSVAITNRTKYHRAWARYAQALVRYDKNTPKHKAKKSKKSKSDAKPAVEVVPHDQADVI